VARPRVLVRGYEGGAARGRCRISCELGPRWAAFTGISCLTGARLHNWFDSEWDYGFAAGVWGAGEFRRGRSAGYDPAWLLPSHGPMIFRCDPRNSRRFQDKLRRF